MCDCQEIICDSASTDTTERQFTEQHLVRAYTRLFLTSKRKDGSRSVSLARFGTYEVFIFEVAQDNCAPQFWMELYAHDIELGLDSCACDDLEQAVIAGRDLISKARRLYEDSCH